ncbi:MAG: calcium/sodium antiporter [archaeon]|nr:calcium/sodium antiporter [archaeon]
MLEFIIFAISLSVLIYSAKLITDTATHFARVLGASEFLVGATVVALGTSLPELSSSIEAMHSGLTGIVIGNVIGSNVANIALVLGIASIFYTVKTRRNILKHDIPFLFISAFATIIVLLDSKITATEGTLLLITYIAYLAYSIKIHKKHDKHKKTKLKQSQIIIFLAGLAGLIYSAKYLITSSSAIMSTLGISEAIIGFILIAIGTSLPELATSIVAAKQGKTDMMIGDIIGSNTFNSLIVLGASSFIGPVAAATQFLVVSLPSMLLLTIFLAFIVYDKKITKTEGTTLLLLYIIILVVIL